MFRAGELLHFDIAREESRRAVRAAEEKDSFVFLTTQKDSAKTTVKAEDVFSMGVICRIRQTVNMPGGMLRALVLGLCRARIKDARPLRRAAHRQNSRARRTRARSRRAG